MVSPLPPRDGINPSVVWLSTGPWLTLMDFLLERFPNVPTTVWRNRLDKGEVVSSNGERMASSSHYRAGLCLYYYREIADEEKIPFFETVLHETEHLLVVDKPHFLPVTPSGMYLKETLLTRLRQTFNNPTLSPIHRLDRDTAGVILFSKNSATRGAYQQLFAERAVHKTYHAIARTQPDLSFPLIHRSRLAEANQFFIMHEIEGEANSETRISLMKSHGTLSLYQLEPLTGKKHQLRVHMSSLGMPIINDAFYPLTHPKQADDYSRPLQLLAKKIKFIDPTNHCPCSFESMQVLKLGESLS
ncbi:pseudouridine synthase [Ephemeroptericola cinctiostellae]|nr:pseudouridine synthase [Ephemeroptericola cinctiostellae]